jgi:hypothetical protein
MSWNPSDHLCMHAELDYASSAIIFIHSRYTTIYLADWSKKASRCGDCGEILGYTRVRIIPGAFYPCPIPINVRRLARRLRYIVERVCFCLAVCRSPKSTIISILGPPWTHCVLPCVNHHRTLVTHRISRPRYEKQTSASLHGIRVVNTLTPWHHCLIG